MKVQCSNEKPRSSGFRAKTVRQCAYRDGRFRAKLRAGHYKKLTRPWPANPVPRAPQRPNVPKTSRYRAPALEKGLDVLELLAAEKSPLNLSAISQRLGRSSGELFRMLQVLEFKGFITTAENGTGYVLTNKLFALAMAQAPVRSLVETALPIMRKLSHDIGQSCHIAVASEDQIVVITRIERPGDLGFSVRIGYRREIARATSGLVLFAYQSEETRRIWLKRCGSRVRPRKHSSRARTSCAARPPRSGLRFRARHRRPVRAHPARRHRGRGAHHPLRAQQSAGDGNDRRRWNTCARRRDRFQTKSCTGTFHDR